jgi:hypothetical protein
MPQYEFIHSQHNRITETTSLQNCSYTVQNGYELVPKGM